MVFWTCVFWLDSICQLAGTRTSRIQDFKREYCAVGLGSSPAWVSWLTGAGVRLFCQLRSSDAHSYIMSSPSVGSSSSSRFPDPLRLGHGYGSHPTVLLIPPPGSHSTCSLLPCLFPSSLPDLPTIWTWDELLFLRAVLTRQPPLWWLFSIVSLLKITNHRLTSLVLSIAFRMAMFRLSRDDSTLRYSPRCWEK